MYNTLVNVVEVNDNSDKVGSYIYRLGEDICVRNNPKTSHNKPSFITKVNVKSTEIVSKCEIFEESWRSVESYPFPLLPCSDLSPLLATFPRFLCLLTLQWGQLVGNLVGE